MKRWNFDRRLAFVLSGGGARGALQVGAIRALLEAGYQPDLVTGTSIGAANGAFLSIHGFDLNGIEKLEQIWQSTMRAELISPNLWWETMRILFKPRNGHSFQKVRDFAIENGIKPDLRFKDLDSVYLYPVAADLNSGLPVVFGIDPEERILDSVLASMSLPPWILPEEKDGRYLMDGGAVSNLPVEAAVKQGATEIIALDLLDPAEEDSEEASGIRPLLWKVNRTIETRLVQLEIKLAESQGIPVKHIVLKGDPPVPLWDFRRSVELMDTGYQITKQAISAWQPRPEPAWWNPERYRPWINSLINILD